LLLPLEIDTPREEVLAFEEADDWRMEVTVPEEDPGAPPFVGEDTGTETEALDPPGLL
jgi:hypothetical protein